MAADAPDPKIEPRTTAATAQDDDTPETGKAASLRIIGGLVAVLAGLVVILALGVTGLIIYVVQDSLSAAAVSIITSAFTAVSAIVGAFFGIKIGTDEAKKVQKSADAANASARVYAAHVPKEDASSATTAAENAALQARESV